MTKSNPKDDKRTSPIGLLLHAKEFRDACETLNGCHPDRHPKVPNTDLYRVRLYLIGHALELLFKALLLEKGVTLGQLKKYGHNLERLVFKLKEGGTLTFSSEQEAYVLSLNEYYCKKELEYFKRGFKQYPKATAVCRCANELFAVIEAQLRGKHEN